MLDKCKTGVLLINIGSPRSLKKRDVWRYLAEFLADKRVLDISPILKYLLLYCIILPFRIKKSTRAYARICLKNNIPIFPLIHYTQAFAHKLANEMGDSYSIKWSMRYANYSIESAMDDFHKEGIKKIILFPLFPQYASSTTGSALEEVYRVSQKYWNIPFLTSIDPFYAHPKFIESFSNIAKKSLIDFSPDYVLFSYHGLPVRHILKSDFSCAYNCLQEKDCCTIQEKENSFCYRFQCFTTSKLLANALQLTEGSFSTSFQSRLGRTAWIQPYTNSVLFKLARQGIKKIAVLCPSFVVDCLETLEEIGIHAQGFWEYCGGTQLILIPSLNAEDEWVNAASELIQNQK